MGKPLDFLDGVPAFKPGDPAPTGYMAWHEWAKVQARAGMRQRQCKHCSLWRFSQEMEGGACKEGCKGRTDG